MRRGLAALLLLAAGCAVPPGAPPPVPAPRLVVGEPYQMGGRWSYPSEALPGAETGLAVALPAPASGLTANGEVLDAAALWAAHRTLPLPSAARVTNLETGLSLLLRVNERGPEDPRRLVGLSPRAAALLGVPPGGAARVRVEPDAALSRALAAGLPRADGAGMRVEAAPAGAVERESLAPPPGAREAAVRREGRGPLVAVAAEAPPPPALPERAERGAPEPGLLHLEGGRFASRAAAGRQAARLPGARVEPAGHGAWRVRLGPFGGVAEADAALERAWRAGVSDARIVSG